MCQVKLCCSAVVDKIGHDHFISVAMDYTNKNRLKKQLKELSFIITGTRHILVSDS